LPSFRSQNDECSFGSQSIALKPQSKQAFEKFYT